MKSIKDILKVAVLTLIGCSFSSSQETFELKWNLKEEQPLLFHLIYENLEGDLAFNYEEYKNEEFSSRWFNEMLEDLFQNSNQYAVLSPRSDSLLDASIVTLPGKSSSANFPSFSQRGEINHGIISKSGQNESFFLSPMKKNIFSLFFELPKKTVKRGEEWEIDLNLINDQGLIYPSSSFKKIIVRLDKVEEKQQEKEALIHYEIEEYLKGSYYSKPFETRAKITGKAVFLIEAGRWKRFDAVMSIESTGVMQGSQQVRFALKPLDTIPPEVFDLINASK